MVGPSRAPATARTYRAFVSYSHADKEFGRWLHNRLETYRFPRQFVGHSTVRGDVPTRLGRIFRDEAEAGAADNLKSVIESALSNAHDLIVICSPNAARSPWVDKEIRFFKANRPDGQVFAVILAGTPNAADPVEECFPPALKVQVGADLELLPDLPEEPLAANVADGREDAALRLLAGLSGLTFNDLRDREAIRVRQQRRRAAATMAAALALIAVAAIGIGLAGRQTWANAISRTDLLAAEAERASQANDADKALLLLLAAAPPRRGHFGPGFAESPVAEALLARAAFGARLKRDIQLPRRNPGLLQYRGDTLTVFQGGPGSEFQGSDFAWSEIGAQSRTSRWSIPPENSFGGVVAIGRYGGPAALADTEEDRQHSALRLRDPRTGAVGPPVELFGFPLDVAMSDDGAFVAVLTEPNRLTVMRTSSDLSAQRVLETEIEAAPASFLPDTLVTISADGALLLVTWPGGLECRSLQDGRYQVQRADRIYRHASFAPDISGSRRAEFAVATDDGTVELRDCFGTVRGSFQAHADELEGLQFSADGGTLLTFDAKGEAKLWNVPDLPNTGLMASRFLLREPKPFAVLTGVSVVPDNEGFILSRDGAQVAAIGAEGRVRVWDAGYGHIAGALEGAGARLAMLPDRSAALIDDVGVWRAAEGAPPQLMARFPACTMRNEGCAFTRVVPLAEGRMIAFARNDGWAGVFDGERAVMRSFVHPPREPRAIAMTGDASVVFFNASDARDFSRRATIWDSATGARRAGETTFDFRAETMSADGAMVAGFGFADNATTLVVADARTGARLAATKLQSVFSVAPDDARSRPLAFSSGGDVVFGADRGRFFRFDIRRRGERYELVAVEEPPPEPAWRAEGGSVRDPLTRREIAGGFGGELATDKTGRTLFVLEYGRTLRTFALPPRGAALVEYACARVAPERAAFSDEEMRANPLLRRDDRVPCERRGLLSPHWWTRALRGG